MEASANEKSELSPFGKLGSGGVLEGKRLKFEELNGSLQNERIILRGRVHNLRATGSLCFMILRERISTIQLLIMKSPQITKDLINFAKRIPKESIIEVEGIVQIAKEKIESCTFHDIEMLVEKLLVISEATQLPFHLEDASRSETEIERISNEISALQQVIGNNSQGEEALREKLEELQRKIIVSNSLKLDHRPLDLRTPLSQVIFRIQAGVSKLFREFLTQKNFVEIHTPKLMGSQSEGGASVFQVKYFQNNAYLSQSPQFFKQMAVIGDMERVFEIGPVFRAENANTHRHLTEFTGLDIEMTITKHYHEVVDMLDQLFHFIFEGLNREYAKEIQIFSQYHPYEPIKTKYPAPRLEYPQIVEMLRNVGEEMEDDGDLTARQERKLGKIIKEKYGVDFYIVDKFPSLIRPFYTLPSENPKYANAYDFFIRGEEVLSGSQRVHEYSLLEKQAREKGVDPKTISHYLQSFKYGAPLHGGGGIGLERFVQFFLGLNNIRLASMFPRDPHRIAP